MNLDEWIECLELCGINLTIPETRNAKDWENLCGLLVELKERRMRDEIERRSMKQMAENKTCPFCGGDEVKIYEYYGEAAGLKYGGFYPECTKCGCRLDYYETREDALKAWNTREGEKP